MNQMKCIWLQIYSVYTSALIVLDLLIYINSYFVGL